MMDVFEQRRTLGSFRILIDTREQDTERAQRRYADFGVPFERATLSFGDYAYNATLPDGSEVYNVTETISPVCIVERKMNLDELAACLGRERARFEREMQRARAADARIILLVENASFENLLNGRYRSKLHPNAYISSLAAWSARYDMTVLFCKAETSGRLIKEFLYRDLKERLERDYFG